MSGVVVLCPTRNRPEPLERMIDSFLGTTTHARLAVYIDEDQAEVYADIPSYPRLMCHIGPRMTPVASYNFLWRQHSADVYGAATDDCLFMSPGWDDYLLGKREELPNHIGLISPHLSGPETQIVQFPFVTKEWTDVLGFFAYPHSFHFCWDTVLEMLGEASSMVWAKPGEFSVFHRAEDSPNLPKHLESDAQEFLSFCLLERRDLVRKLRETLRKSA